MFALSAQNPFLSFSTFTLKQDLTPLYTQVYKTMIYKTMSFIPLFRNFRLLSSLLPSRGRTENGPKKGEKTDRAASCAYEKGLVGVREGGGGSEVRMGRKVGDGRKATGTYTTASRSQGLQSSGISIHGVPATLKRRPRHCRRPARARCA